MILWLNVWNAPHGPAPGGRFYTTHAEAVAAAMKERRTVSPHIAAVPVAVPEKHDNGDSDD